MIAKVQTYSLSEQKFWLCSYTGSNPIFVVNCSFYYFWVRKCSNFRGGRVANDSPWYWESAQSRLIEKKIGNNFFTIPFLEHEWGYVKTPNFWNFQWGKCKWYLLFNRITLSRSLSTSEIVVHHWTNLIY